MLGAEWGYTISKVLCRRIFREGLHATRKQNEWFNMHRLLIDLDSFCQVNQSTEFLSAFNRCFVIFDFIKFSSSKSPTSSTSSQLTPSPSEAVKPDDSDVNFGLWISNGLFWASHFKIVLKSPTSRLQRVLPSSTCWSLVLCTSHVTSVMASCTSAQVHAVHQYQYHSLRDDSSSC